MNPGPASPALVQDEPIDPDEVRRTERRADLRAAVITYLACVLLLAIGLTGITTGSPLAPDNRWWHLLPLTAGAALMLVKRHRPILAVTGGAVLLGVDLLLGGSLGTLIVFVDLVYAAALYASPRARNALSIAAGALVVALMVAAGRSSSGDLQVITATGLQGAALIGTPLWWAADVRRKGALTNLAMEREALARAHAADLTRIADLRRREAIQAERRAMARDLHDIVAGHVSAVAIRTGGALTAPDVPARERETLEFVRSSSLTTLAEMRTMIVLLRGDAGGSDQDEALASAGRLGDLSGLVDAHRSGGLDVVVTVAAHPAAHAGELGLPAAVDQAAFRIAQEALTNAAKHGGGGQVVVEVAAAARALTLTVTNPLPTGASGASPTGPSSPGQDVISAGIGLATMRERAEGLGGTFHAGPSGPLWSVRASLPLSEPS